MKLYKDEEMGKTLFDNTPKPFKAKVFLNFLELSGKKDPALLWT